MAYWIQVELKPEGKRLGFLQLDLERVKYLHFIEEDLKLLGVTLYYEGRQFALDELGATHLMREWKKYIDAEQDGLKAISERAKPSNIHIVKSHDAAPVIGGVVND